MSAPPRLTEADLDARELERVSVPIDLDAIAPGCSGACMAGRRACNCNRAEPYTWSQLLRDVVRPFAVAWLRYEISSHEQWIAAARADGIIGTNNLLHCNREVQRLRVRLALWEARP